MIGLLTVATAYLRGFFFVRIFQILHHLFQSGHLHGTWSWIAIRNAEIRGIVDLEGGLDPSKIRKHLDWYHYWHIWDGAISGINLKELWYTAHLIKEKIDSGMNVLVHCQGGVNRASLVNGCVLYLQGLRGTRIIDHIRKRRPHALTNSDFVRYLSSLVRDGMDIIQ